MTVSYALINRSNVRHLPNFILLGQGKAGTSLIFRHLKAQAGVTVSSRKELHFFSNNYHKGLDWYENHFPDLIDTEVVAEISPSYLCPRAIRRIAKTLGTDIQVAFVLRRPLEHCYSRYIQNICARKPQDSLPEKLESIPSRLRTIEHAIALCYQIFGADRVLPLFYETDIAGPEPVFAQKLAQFLGLDMPLPDKGFPKVNQGVMPWLAYVPHDTVVWQGEARYKIPQNHLVFCAQPRNSRILVRPSDSQLERARRSQAAWCKELPARYYASQQESIVIPASHRLEKLFGFDMSHWRNPPYQLSYPPASLPAILKLDEA